MTIRSCSALRRFQASLIATLAAMALAACGGGDSVAGAAPAAPTAQTAAAQLPTASLLAGTTVSTTSTSTSGSTVGTVGMTKVTFSNSDGQALAGFMFRDPTVAQRNAAVVLMHGCSGIWSNGVVDTSAQPPQSALSHIHRRWGTALARAGYVVLLVDSFTPRNLTNECGNGTAGLNEAVVRPRDALAGRQWLLDQGLVAPDRIALLGWSNGASAVLATMDGSNEGTPGARPFREGFAFYPGCGLLNNFGGDASTLAKTSWAPYAPVAIHHAQLDPLWTDGRCSNRVAGAQAQGASVALTVYTGARHSFDQVDVSKPLSSPYTSSDVDAQGAADAVVQQRLATLFPL